jgi:hypothetical protein
MAESLDERRERLGAAIGAARTRAAARRDLDWAEIGDLLDALSQDLNEVTHLERSDPAAHARCDAIEARLDALQARLGENRSG